MLHAKLENVPTECGYHRKSGESGIQGITVTQCLMISLAVKLVSHTLACHFRLYTMASTVGSKRVIALQSFAYGTATSSTGKLTAEAAVTQSVSTAVSLPLASTQPARTSRRRRSAETVLGSEAGHRSVPEHVDEAVGRAVGSGATSSASPSGVEASPGRRKRARAAVTVQYEGEGTTAADVCSTESEGEGSSGTGLGRGVTSTQPRPVGKGKGAAVPASPSNPYPFVMPPGSPSKGYGAPVAPHAAWREQLAAIKRMREVGGVASNAPVDTMGCERCVDPAAEPRVQRFQTLVGLLLSSQTRDEVTYACVQRLIAHPSLGRCSPEAVAAAPLTTLEQVLFGPPAVGFWRNKAKYLQGTASACVSQHGGDIPASLEGLCSLPGIGPKMAFITLNVAWGARDEAGRPVVQGSGSAGSGGGTSSSSSSSAAVAVAEEVECAGIGVDTHVHRIANRLGWVRTQQPEATRVHLQSWLPREEWRALNVLLVGFGQSVCTPLAPKCGQCDCRAMCPVGQGVLSPKVKKV